MNREDFDPELKKHNFTNFTYKTLILGDKIKKEILAPVIGFLFFEIVKPSCMYAFSKLN